MSAEYTGPRDRARRQEARILHDSKRRALRVAFWSAAGQAAAKGAAGWFTGSLSLLAMAADSVSDLLNTAVARLAVAAGARPPDPEHPFGHGKIEPLGGLLQVVILLPIVYGLVRGGIDRVLHGGQVAAPGLGMAVIALSALAGYYTARHLDRAARGTDSPVLRGAGLAFRLDAVTHTGVLLALLAVGITGRVGVDAIVSIAVALYVLGVTLGYGWRAISELMDPRIAERYRRLIELELEEHKDEFLDYHRLRTRRAGPEKHIDLHLTVCKYRTLEESHRLVDHLENGIEAIVPQSHVIIHVDPCKPDQSCLGEDVCPLALSRRGRIPQTGWPPHPVGPAARAAEREQHGGSAGTSGESLP